MSLAEKISLTAALIFFMTGLLTGIWKYRHMARSADASSPTYVNIAHRSSLMYSFAALLLAVFSAHSVFSDLVNTLAAVSALAFFAFAITTYVIHGLLQDTDNQLQRPHRLGKRLLPPWVTGLFMLLLIVGEVGGSLVLGLGAMLGIWSV
ncbi:hypothetical protein DYI22_12775 [Marinobacter lipolyticus]|uniref:hypothetical protein n=1 Tax=Marinobacter lipolyticus TaxID=209639 RepID=UPI001BCF70D4|nr:hypothetical protein [Marinobacter lipolyticus]MBS8241369.1 hypothetical protein [Marinobacter lipolyticus]